MIKVVSSIAFLLGISSRRVQSQCNDDYAVCSSRQNFAVSSDLDAYYDLANGKTGSDLKAALNAIISGHYRYSYSCVWTALGELDKDDRGIDHVRGIYTQRPIPRLNRDGCTLGDGSQNTDPDAWNREHLFPKVMLLMMLVYV